MEHTRRAAKALAALVIGALVVSGVSTAEAGTPDRLPTLEAVQRIFPEVTERSYDGDDGDGPFYPSCAGLDGPAGPPTVVNRYGGFTWDGIGDRDAVPGSNLLTFRTVRQAKTAMTKLRRHLKRCVGYLEDVDTYSRYRLIKTPPLGDDRVGFQGSWQTTFEDPYPRVREIWVREGRTVVVASVSQVRGKLPARKTRKLAGVVLRAARP